MSASGLVFAFAETIVLLDSARFLQGVGGAFSWIGGFAWLVSAAPAERRGELIGAALAAAIVGILIGPVIGSIAAVVGSAPVFSSAALIGTALAVWAHRTAAPPPAAPPSWRRLGATVASRPVLAGFWFVMLPAVFSGVTWVLAPLRLDELGASTLAIGAVFLIAAIAEAVASPTFGRVSDRRGRLWPIRLGLAAAALCAVVLPLPELVVWVGLAVIAAELALGLCWTPAMALLSDSVERAGVEQWLAFALVNLAWAGGQVAGASGGGGLAEATSDAVPFAISAGALALTAAAISAGGRRTAAEAAVPQ
jgi:MFS family permease